MPIEMPTEGDFQLLRDDLQPLADEFGEGVIFVPDGLEEVIEMPMSNGHLNAIPWEFHVTPKVRFRDEDLDMPIVIAGTTILQRDTDESEPVFWRFVDWSAVRAQLGVSFGRGEYSPVQDFVDLNNSRVDR